MSFHVNSTYNYSNVLSDSKTIEMLDVFLDGDVYNYKCDLKEFYNIVEKYKNNKNEKLFELFEKPSSKTYKDFIELIENLAGIKSHMMMQLVSHFILATIYRFVNTHKKEILELEKSLIENKKVEIIVKELNQEIKNKNMLLNDSIKKTKYLNIELENKEKEIVDIKEIIENQNKEIVKNNNIIEELKNSNDEKTEKNITLNNIKTEIKNYQNELKNKNEEIIDIKKIVKKQNEEISESNNIIRKLENQVIQSDKQIINIPKEEQQPLKIDYYEKN